MANFVALSGAHGLEHINLDLVRRVTQDMDGNVILHFDLTHQIKLEGLDASRVMDEVNRCWQKAEAVKAA